MIASLLIDYFVEKDIEFNPLGSFTQEKGEEVSAQADESFLIGKSTGITPDISIEVVFPRGGKAQTNSLPSIRSTRSLVLGGWSIWPVSFGIAQLRDDLCYHRNSPIF